MSFSPELEYARRLDREDPLRAFREAFLLPEGPGGQPLRYFTGNSLGLQPRRAAQYLQEELDDWARLGVEGHFHARRPWMPYHHFLTESLARLAGALPEEVVAMNALTVNLHLLMVSFYRPQAGRACILIESDAFPSDRYAVESQLRFHGQDPAEALLLARPRPGEFCLRTEDICSQIEAEGHRIALVLLGGVNYYTGQLLDMGRITAAARAQGCSIGWDLAHAIGNVPLRLHDWGADFAAWCSYKYLNGGPGGVAGAFVHQRHASDPALPRFAGWWGHREDTRFQMRDAFDPIPGAAGWQLSNAPVFQMAALRASLDLFDRAGMEALRAKSEQMTAYFRYLLELPGGSPGIELITPAEAGARGCQLSLLCRSQGRARFERLSREGFLCDWREPDVIRAAPVPLYNSFEDVWHLAEALRRPL